MKTSIILTALVSVLAAAAPNDAPETGVAVEGNPTTPRHFVAASVVPDAATSASALASDASSVCLIDADASILAVKSDRRRRNMLARSVVPEIDQLG
ncbi:hypothetical protein AJ80_00059 [Polytolypa hystricis UAMH7299]|uniref:Uncharacterized protein n=1 Tax=Polytolypa hystricis (strain UAMH7299) TaxID=1447883 RepID=A0A2B7Z4J6_POLH7|nr:hypothetical protein AJ80_00059 [Polytolypa hystricis UAMH7299]